MSATRTQLLDAATTVLLDQGAAHLSLAAVAAEAGVSKGGLLYHFPSKRALVEGLVDRMVADFDAALETGSGPGSTTRAYLQHSVSATGETAADPRRDAAILAALLVEPASLRPLRDRYAAWQERLTDDGVDPAVATLVRLVADGWWLAEILDLAPPDAATGAQLGAVIERILTDGTRDAP